MTANDPIVQRLMSHHPRVITLGLERIEQLLKQLGSPEKKLPPLVHVAGTNGKGSLVAYLRAMAEAAGIASTSTPRRISCASTSASGLPAS